MKTIWMILIGMILFNGFLIAFNPFFEQSPQSSGLYNVNDIENNEALQGFKKPGTLSFSVTSILFVGTTDILIAAVTALMTILRRDLKYVAAGSITALISNLWAAGASVFSDLFNSLNNPVLPGIFTMISVAIGICVAIMILGIFTSQDQLT